LVEYASCCQCSRVQTFENCVQAQWFETIKQHTVTHRRSWTRAGLAVREYLDLLR
jgi:hypothetical protein